MKCWLSKAAVLPSPNKSLCNGAFACHHFVGDRIWAIKKETQVLSTAFERMPWELLNAWVSRGMSLWPPASKDCVAPSAITRLTLLLKYLTTPAKNSQTIEHFLEVMMICEFVLLIAANTKTTLSPSVDTLWWSVDAVSVHTSLTKSGQHQCQFWWTHFLPMLTFDKKKLPQLFVNIIDSVLNSNEQVVVTCLHYNMAYFTVKNVTFCPFVEVSLCMFNANCDVTKPTSYLPGVHFAHTNWYQQKMQPKQFHLW